MSYMLGHSEDYSFGYTSVRISVEASSWSILFLEWCKIKVSATISNHGVRPVGMRTKSLRLDVRFPMPKSQDHYLAATRTTINSYEISLSKSYSSLNHPFINNNPWWMFWNSMRNCWALYAVQIEYAGQTYEFTGRLLSPPPESEPGWL